MHISFSVHQDGIFNAKYMLDFKTIKDAAEKLAEGRQLDKKILWTAIEFAFAAAYKKEYAKPEQIIRARLNEDTKEITFFQTKIILDTADILPEGEMKSEEMEGEEEDKRVTFNPERHIMLEDAKMVQHGVNAGEELLFPLETKTEFGRIATQTARQTIIQKLHEAEKEVAISEFRERADTLVTGRVQRIERGNIYIDLGRTIAILPFSEQIRGERFKQGELIQTYILSVDPTRRSGGFVMLSRATPNFVSKLFELEVPELVSGDIVIKNIVRDVGSRTKIAVETKDQEVDPIGSLVGQRGIRVLSVKNELGGEQIDVIEWTENTGEFLEEALSPAEVIEVTEKGEKYIVKVSDDQIPILIGKGGQNISLAARLVAVDVEVINQEGEKVATIDKDGENLELFGHSDRLVRNTDGEVPEMVKQEEETNTEMPAEETSGEEPTTEETVEESPAEETSSEEPTAEETVEESPAEEIKEEKGDTI